MPYISIILPVYNRCKFLPEAIDSIINQTLKDFELLIINDGSDNTECLEIISQHEKRDSRIRVIHQENHGVSHARNTAIDNLQGRYAAFMDGDDISHPTRLEKQVAFLNQHSNVAAVGTLEKNIDSHGHFIKRPSQNISKPCIYKPHDWHKLEDTAGLYVGPPHAMWRAEILKEIKFRVFFTISGDADIALRLIEKYPVATIPDKLYYLRKHNTNIFSVSSSERMLYFKLAAFLSAHRRRQDKPDPVDENTNVLDLIPLFKELPTSTIVYLLKGRLRHKSKRLLYNRLYGRLVTLLSNMDKAFLDSEHAEAYGRIRKKNLRTLAQKALQHGRWGWFAHRLNLSGN